MNASPGRRDGRVHRYLLLWGTTFFVCALIVVAVAVPLTVLRRNGVAAIPLADSSGAPMAPEVVKAEELGLQNTKGFKIGRDLGFSGKIGDSIINTYGDSVQCGYTPGDALIDSLGCSLPSASDSVSIGDLKSPVDVTTPPKYLKGGFPQQFCKTYDNEPMNNGQWAIGITQVHQVTKNEGMLFFLINNRTDGQNPILVGSGVAKITMEDGVPTCTRLQRKNQQGRAKTYYWDAAPQKEPNYGAYASLSGTDGYIYGFGGKDKEPWIWLNRVKASQYKDLSAYRYWNGQAWQKQRLINPTEKEAVMQSRGQSSMFWNPYLKKYIMTSMVLGGLAASVADKPVGPWSEWKTIYTGPACTEKSCSYGGAMQPWYDPSGKTVVIGYTPAEGIGLQLRMIRLTFA